MNVFPEQLKLRATGLHDDLGGLGQAIFTTAGQGYERQAYIRSDLVDALRVRADGLAAWIENVATDGQLDAPVPCLGGKTARELLSAQVERQAAARTQGSVAEMDALRALATELADDLEAEIAARYPENSRGHKSVARRYQRDMEIVDRTRQLLNNERR